MTRFQEIHKFILDKKLPFEPLEKDMMEALFSLELTMGRITRVQKAFLDILILNWDIKDKIIAPLDKSVAM